LSPIISYFSLSISSSLCILINLMGRGWVEPYMTASKRFGSFPNCYLYGSDKILSLKFCSEYPISTQLSNAILKPILTELKLNVICSLIGSKFAACLSMSNPRRRIQILRLDLQPILDEVPPPLVTGHRCSDPRRFFRLFDLKFRLCVQTLSPW
jgi:hypothetical protein